MRMLYLHLVVLFWIPFLANDKWRIIQGLRRILIVGLASGGVRGGLLIVISSIIVAAIAAAITN